MALIARILLSIALLVQGVGAIASEIHSATHPHCHGMGSPEQPHKRGCCQGNDCTTPECSSVCVAAAAAFIVPMTAAVVVPAHPSQPRLAVATLAPFLDTGPPTRPPIA